MTTRYLSITPDGEPYPLDLDENDRVRFVFNVRSVSRASTQFEEELIKLLVDASVGTWAGSNRDIFVGPKANIPTGDGPYLLINPSPGAPPMHTHNSPGAPAYERPSAQIVVRGASYTAARTMARNAYLALWTRNAEVAAVS